MAKGRLPPNVEQQVRHPQGCARIAKMRTTCIGLKTAWQLSKASQLAPKEKGQTGMLAAEAEAAGAAVEAAGKAAQPAAEATSPPKSLNSHPL